MGKKAWPENMQMSLLSGFKPGHTGFFRHRRLGNRWLLTNDLGQFALLADNDFQAFLSGRLKSGTALHARLEAGSFLAGKTDISVLAGKWRKKNSFLFAAPSLHIVVLTKRCNHSCLYCQAGSSTGGSLQSDMTRKTAVRVLDTIFSSPSKNITLEFQGGEPLLNWPTLAFMVSSAEERARRGGKSLRLSLVTNLSAMTAARLDFLLRHKVQICTSLDGPAKVHNLNRKWSAGNSYEATVKWLKIIRERAGKGQDSGDALVSVTKASLPHWKAIVDEYVRLRLPGIFVRFINPFGAAKRCWDTIGYSAAEYVAFYKKTLDYIIELNLSGKARLAEHAARILLVKILGEEDPNYMDLRSPCGAGIGQLAYDYDGRVFTCDEGRMLAAMGDNAFCAGDSGAKNYAKIVSSPAVKCVVTASITDIQVSCSACAYKPYCGVCPVYNYSEHGDLFAHYSSYRCSIYTGMFDHIFNRLQNKKVRRLFDTWVADK